MPDDLTTLLQQLERSERDNTALRQQLSDQSWLKAAIDATNNTVIVTDPHQADNPIIYANKGFERLTGYSVAETLGRNCRFLQGDDADQAEVAVLRNAIRAGQGARVVLRNYRKDGSLFWNELYITPVYQGERLAHFVGVQNDISPFVKAQQELALLGTAVEQADESIVITDAQLEQPGPKITYVNAAFERLTGYRRDEVIGETPRLLQGPKTDPQLLGRLRRTLAAGETFRGEAINYRKNGEPFVNEWHIAPIEQGGAVTHWVATQRDITERRELERLVLEASSLEQQRVAQDLHDTLGQHLTGTAFMARSLAKRLGASHDPDAAAEAEQLTALVNEAIAQTRALARGLYPAALQVQGLVGALEQLCETSRKVFGVACTFSTVGQPEASADEAMHLYRIAQEALNNAFKHGQARQLEVRWQQGEHGRSLSVRDDGVGIGDLNVQNPGLGLRIMRYRAQLIGGTLSITSKSITSKSITSGSITAESITAGPEKAGTLIRCTLPQQALVTSS